MISPKQARLIARATAGDAEALASLAQHYEEGKGFKKSLDEAMRYWRLAAEKNHPRALARLVDHHLSDAHRDEALAVAYARRGAETGNPAMMSLYGRMALAGTGMAVDLALANEMLSRAAERHDLDALIAYGENLLSGRGVAANVSLGLAYLSLAAQRDSEAAMAILAKVYDEGSVTPHDPYQAYVYYGQTTHITDWHAHGAPFERLLAELTREQAVEAKRVIDMFHYEKGHTDWAGPNF